MTAYGTGRIKPLPPVTAATPVAAGVAGQTNLPWESSITELLSISDWYRFVPEALGLVLLIALIQTWLPDVASGGPLPHPFWVPVLLMSGQYGIMGGLFATLSAAAALYVGGLPSQSATQDFYAYAAVVASQPCAWFATALIIGGLRTLHIHQHADVQERLTRTTVLADDLADGLEQAVGEIERLESRIAGDSSTLASVMRHLASIDATDRLALTASFADVVRFAVAATSFAIYLDVGHGLEACVGVEDRSRIALTAIPALSPSLLAAVQAADPRREVSAEGDRPDELPCWAPIFLPGASRPTGVIVCNRLEPSQVPSVARRRLNEVCRVLQALLAALPEDPGASEHDKP